VLGAVDKDRPVTSLSSGGPGRERAANSSQMGVSGQQGNVEARQSSVEGVFAGGSVLEEGKEGHREASTSTSKLGIICRSNRWDVWRLTLGPSQIQRQHEQACRQHGTTTPLAR
jgi:hypothetical protein